MGPAGAEQFVKEFTVGPEWRFFYVPLASMRRTWGAGGTDGQLQKELVREVGFEPASPDRPLDVYVDSIRLTRSAARD
jgi:hypothetical protein